MQKLLPIRYSDYNTDCITLVKMIIWRSYFPQSQCKIERSHKKFRKKLHYDMVHQKSKGVIWVENIPNYMAVLYKVAREQLGWRSRFEIYYGRISNVVSRLNLEHNPAGNYMFNVNNRNTRTRSEICSKLTIKIPEQRQWCLSAI